MSVASGVWLAGEDAWVVLVASDGEVSVWAWGPVRVDVVSWCVAVAWCGRM